MNEQRKRGDIIDYLLLMGSVGIFFLGLCSGCFLLFQLITRSDGGAESPTLSGIFMIAALCLVGVPAAIISLRSIQGREIPRLEPPIINLTYIIILFILTLVLGYFTLERSSHYNILSTIVHISAAAIPATIAILLVIRHNPPISQRRFWGSLFIGTWVIPTSAILIELVLMVVGMATLVFGSLATPEGQLLIDSLSTPEFWTSETMLENFGTIFDQPIIIIAIFLFVCFLVPIIEESLKSLAIIPILRRKPSPTESFLSGILGGVGFAFVEALFLTPTGADWTQTMFTRSGATMMHTFTAGVTCWGIGQAITYKRWNRFFGAFSVAIIMHGLWNAAAIGIGIGILPSQGGEELISMNIAQIFLILGIMVLVGLSVLATTGLIVIPERLREDKDISSLQSEINVEPTYLMPPDEGTQSSLVTNSREDLDHE